MQKFDFHATPLSGLYIVNRYLIEDVRGFFSRFFCAKEFHRIGFDHSISQMNHTKTEHKGTVRGFHYQNVPYAEIKIVSCIKGRVLYVAIDIRQNSPTFLKWFAVELSEKNNKSLYIPAGFAHGFQTLEDDCELLYMHSEFYNSDSEGALNILDPAISMEWPLNISQISKRDASSPMININTFKGLNVK